MMIHPFRKPIASFLVFPILLAAASGQSRAEPDPPSFPSDPELLLTPDGSAPVMRPASPVLEAPIRRSDAQVLTDPASLDLCDAIAAARQDTSVAIAAGENPDTERSRNTTTLIGRCQAGFRESSRFDCPAAIAFLTGAGLPDGMVSDQCLYALAGTSPRVFPAPASSPLPSLCARAAVTASGFLRPTDPDAAATRIAGLTEACLAVTNEGERCGTAITRPLVAAASGGRGPGLLDAYRRCLAAFGGGSGYGRGGVPPGPTE